MVVEPHLAEPSERELGEATAGLGVRDDALVPGPLGDEDEQPVGAELIPSALRERNVAEVRRVEDAAEDRGGHDRIRVSSPTSTSAPVLAPAARRAASSSSGPGAEPVTRKPRSVRRIRKAPRASGRGR